MAEWLYEDGIGERRAALIADGRIRAGAIERDDDGVAVGTVAAARWIGGIERAARLGDGELLYLPRGVGGASEGATIRVRVTRSAMPEAGLIKRAVAQVTDAPLGEGPSLFERISADLHPVRRIGAHQPDALVACGWNELLDEAAQGLVAFPGGVLRIALTPAMTVVDVDGETGGLPLAEAAVAALPAAIARHGIGGNIVVDLPTLANAAARREVAGAFDRAMAAADLRYERTAINGFGLLQIICPRERPSLIERLHFAPVASAALALLRRAERARGAGPMALTAHPAVVDWLGMRPALLAELQRRTGRPPALHAAPQHAMDAGHAQ